MNRRILIVEDDVELRTDIAEYLDECQYTTTTANDGEAAYKILTSAEAQFGAIILDLRMPNMTGEQLLAKISEEALTVAPIVVLSAHLDRDAIEAARSFGVKCLFKKSVDPMYFERAIDAIVQGDDSSLLSLANDPGSGMESALSPSIVLLKLTKELRRIVEEADPDARDPIVAMVKRRESTLRDYFVDRANHRLPIRAETDEGLLIIARRWNSWYPSFFDVPGGCYVVTSPAQKNQPCSSTVIDPGFKCLSVLRDLGVAIQDIGSCVMSHNHPDHIGGLLELLASRHALGKSTQCWGSKTTRKMFGDCSGFGLQMDELNTKIESRLFSYLHEDGQNRNVSVKGFQTAHREMGRVSGSLGIVISCCLDDPQGDRLLGKGVILGDTEYDRASHRSFVTKLTSEGVKFVVLHVGSIQQKQREGGHLYYPGLKRILIDMEAKRERAQRTDVLPVLLSEWGLEHATTSQMKKIVGKTMSGFDDDSPMLEIAEALNKEFRTMCIIPADIGLAVGLETGRVYLPDGSCGQAEDLKTEMAGAGIKYAF